MPAAPPVLSQKPPWDLRRANLFAVYCAPGPTANRPRGRGARLNAVGKSTYAHQPTSSNRSSSSGARSNAALSSDLTAVLRSPRAPTRWTMEGIARIRCC